MSGDEPGQTPLTDASRVTPEIHTYPAEVSFYSTNLESGEEKQYTFKLQKDINFVTAHPCVPSQHVKILKSPSSPTIQQVDLSGFGAHGKTASLIGKHISSCLSAPKFILSSILITDPHILGHPLHKCYTYTALHLSELLAKRDFPLEALLGGGPSKPAFKVLVVDCITGFQPLPQEHEIPLSPVVSRSDRRNSRGAFPFDDVHTTPLARRSSGSIEALAVASGAGGGAATNNPGGAEGRSGLESASKKMHSESRRRQFGSDMEILIRALCAEKGWNALISRRRRGCLACAIREAGALGWKVVIRVD